ncbi:MAG TPA: hypothetical protein VGE02_02105 [Gemmatimonadales bacterium]
MRRPSLAASLAVALAGLSPLTSAAHAQDRSQVPVLDLRTPDARWAEPFTALGGVRELGDGRVIVADRTEKSIQLLDLARGASTRIGREGGGPNEYRVPGPVLALPGDSTAVFDMGSMRYLLVAPDGSVAGTFSTADPSRPDMRLALPARGVDGAGNLYLFDRGIGLRPGGGPPVQPADSGTVLRFDRRTRTLTPVARVAVPKAEISSEGSATNRRVMVRTGTPFAAQDEWAVGLDGRVAVVRHDPYRVEWLAPGGRRVTGPAMPYERLRVTERDREEYRERSRSGAGIRMAVTVGGEGASTRMAPTTASAALPEPGDWPEFKPPFLAGAATVAPDGRLWVLRTRPAGDDVPRYDVFDSFGELSATVILPPATRLLGFGRNSAYVVRKDADELEYLERYRLW